MSFLTPFEARLMDIQDEQLHAAAKEVMDMFDVTVVGLKGNKVQFSASDAVRLTELIFQQAGKTIPEVK